ncbi:MAG: lysophospholipid acyltransferase family protein [Candidatus Binatia bacterium]
MIDKSMRLIAHGLAAGHLQTVASGLENLSAEGPALIVARHYHHLYDGLALFAAIHRPFHIVVSMDWVQNKWTKFFFETANRLARWPTVLRRDALTRRANDQRSFFTEHDVIRYQRKAMRQSVDLLVAGRLLVIFSEGYPNVDPVYTTKTEPEEFLPFKRGFLHIVAAAEKRLNQSIPIVPAGVHYTRGSPWIAHLRFGSPLYRDKNAAKEELVKNLERAVKHLSSESASPCSPV